MFLKHALSIFHTNWMLAGAQKNLCTVIAPRPTQLVKRWRGSRVCALSTYQVINFSSWAGFQILLLLLLLPAANMHVYVICARHWTFLQGTSHFIFTTTLCSRNYYYSHYSGRTYIQGSEGHPTCWKVIQQVTEPEWTAWLPRASNIRYF